MQCTWRVCCLFLLAEYRLAKILLTELQLTEWYDWLLGKLLMSIDFYFHVIMMRFMLI